MTINREEYEATEFAKRCTIKPDEYHPAADSAMQYVRERLTILDVEAFASVALSDNRLAEICSGTIDRLRKGLPVSDRYLLGLAWILRNMDDMRSTKCDSVTSETKTDSSEQQ